MPVRSVNCDKAFVKLLSHTLSVSIFYFGCLMMLAKLKVVSRGNTTTLPIVWYSVQLLPQDLITCLYEPDQSLGRE